MYHVLETVESSLVEPEEPGSTSEDNSAQKQKEKENVSDVVQLQPSTLAEETTVDASGGLVPLTRPEAQDISEDKQCTSIALVSSENQGASLAAADAPLLGKNEQERAEQDKTRGKHDHVDTADVHKEKKKARSSKDPSSPEQSWFSGWGLSSFTGAVQQTVRIDHYLFYSYDLRMTWEHMKMTICA